MSGAVFISTEFDMISGTYGTVIEFGPDDVVPVDVPMAKDYAWYVSSVLADAEYDAAVVKQGQYMELDDEGIGALVMYLRGKRETITCPVAGWKLLPGVGQRTRTGFITVSRHDVTLGEWTLDDARAHLLLILEAVRAAENDTLYGGVLRDDLQVGSDRALNVVAHLSEFRPRQS